MKRDPRIHGQCTASCWTRHDCRFRWRWRQWRGHQFPAPPRGFELSALLESRYSALGTVSSNARVAGRNASPQDRLIVSHIAIEGDVIDTRSLLFVIVYMRVDTATGSTAPERANLRDCGPPTHKSKLPAVTLPVVSSLCCASCV